MEVYMIIVILYIPLVCSAFDDDFRRTKYKRMEVGSLCSGSWEGISRAGDCVRASQALDLQFEAMWDGPGDFPGCLYANDGRDRVYYNINPRPSKVANNQNYTAICIRYENSSCYADDSTPYRKFSEITSYLINANLDTTEVSVPGCKPAMLWAPTRHGSRGPLHSDIESMNKTLPGIKQAILQAWEDGKSKLCHKDVINLKNWKFIYSPDEDQQLGQAGKREMRALGERFGKRFPDLLKDTQKTVRKTIPEQRTHDSLDAFLIGLYGHRVDFENSTEDMFTFYRNCPAYLYGVLKNNRVETNKLRDSEAYEKMVAGISDRIGVQLNKTQVELAWKVCGYEIANYPDEVSPWCALFSEGDNQLIEYSCDLSSYYEFHYNVSWQMSQPLMADLHQKLSSLKAGNKNTSAFLYMVHSRVGHSILVALANVLGLYRDAEPPLASDWPSPHTVWDSSVIFSFGHNLALVALQCDDPQDPLKVLAMHNERRISMAGICGEEICPLQIFLDKIQPIVDVDFDKVCEFKEPS